MEQTEHSSEAKLNALYRLGQQLILLLDEQAITETVLEIAEDVLDFGDSEFLMVDASGQELFVSAHRGDLNVAQDLRLSLTDSRGITVAAARRGEPVYVSDVGQEPRYVDAGFEAASELAVPVQVEGQVLGVINVESRRLNAYTPGDARLLATLASEAALALQNARHHTQERRQKEQLATINRVACRISATLDLRDTLDTIVEAAYELVPCVLAEISLWDEEREMLTLQALRCEPERRFPIGETYPLGQGYTGWLVRHQEPLLVTDVAARRSIRPELLPGELPFAAYLGVPLIASDELIGTLVMVHDQTGGFDEDDLALLQSLAAQAAIAIRNAQLFEETERRSRELAALNAVAASVNRALGLEILLADALDRVSQCVEADGGGIRLLDAGSGKLTLSITQGISEEYVAKVRNLQLGEGIVGDVALTGEPALLADMSEDPRVPSEVVAPLKEEGIYSFAVVPLRSQEEVIGTLGVLSRTPGAFGPPDVHLLIAMGHQLGTAIANAQLRQAAIDAEQLAAVGRVAASVAHELRSPLGGIMRSAEFLARPELSEATREKLGSAIVAMARRLINTSQELLDYTRGGRMTLHRAPYSLPGFLEEVLEVLRVDFSDRGIAVKTDWGYRGRIPMDADRMAQVVYNVAANARDAMPHGGQLTVATEHVEGDVEIRFTDTGPGVPEELRERIFEPFVSYGKQEGAGLGLAIAERIVQEHGGAIEVESPESGGATFIVRLPLG